MDASSNSQADGDAVALAERAREVTRGLYHLTRDASGRGGIDRAAQVRQVLEALAALVDNLSQSLPALGAWLEQQMLSGDLDRPGGGPFDGLVRAVHDVTAALARAHTTGARLGQELRTAQTASAGLVTP